MDATNPAWAVPCTFCGATKGRRCIRPLSFGDAVHMPRGDAYRRVLASAAKRTKKAAKK